MNTDVKSKTFPYELLIEFKSKLKAEGRKPEHYEWLCEVLGKNIPRTTFKDTRLKLEAEIQQNYLKSSEFDIKETPLDIDKLKYSEKYIYNKELQEFVYLTEKMVGYNTVLKKHEVDALCERYSNYDKNQDTQRELEKKFSIPIQVIKYILNAHGIVHDSIPYTDETLAENTTDDLAIEALAKKRYNFNQKFNKLDWKETQKLAHNYLLIESKYLNPFQKFLENWKPKKFSVGKSKKVGVTGRDYVLVIADPHFGATANENYLWHGKGWDIDRAVEQINKLAKDVKEDIESRKYKIKTAWIVFAGDLLHSLTGNTNKGTRLNNTNPLYYDQLEYTADSLQFLIDELLSIFNKVKVRSVTGNHSMEGDYAVVWALSKYYSKNEKIDFDISKKRWSSFRVRNSLFYLEHGESPIAKSHIPKGNSPREAYIQRIMLSKPELLQGVESKYFLSGHLHSSESKEFTGFEFIQFGTMMQGDLYADHLNLHNRPRIDAFMVDDKIIKERITYDMN